MKKFPRACKQTYAKQGELMFIALPSPQDPKKPKRYYLGSYYATKTREIYDHLAHLYAIGVSKEDIARLLDSGALKQGIKGLMRASKGLIETGSIPLPSAPTADDTTLTLADLFERFIATKVPIWSKDGSGYSVTKSRYKNIAQKLKDYLHLPVDSFTRSMYMTWRDYLVDLGLKRQSVNIYSRNVLNMYRWGVNKGLVREQTYTSLAITEPLKVGETTAPELNDRTSIPESIIYATLPHLPEMAQVIVQLLMLTGARPSEICGAKWEEIDRVSRQDGQWILRPTRHKSSRLAKKRVIPLNTQARKIIEEWAEKHKIRRGFLFPTCQADRPTTITGHYKANSLCQTINAVTKRHGIPHWYPYAIRHSVATIIAHKDVQDAQALLGHTLSSTTERHYIDKDEERAVQVSKRLRIKKWS